MRVFFVFLLVFVFNHYTNGQPKNEIHKLYGRIIEMDSVFLESDVDNNISFAGYKYFYSIFHIKILDHHSDTITIGVVYNLLEDLANLNRQFEFKKDSLYTFYVSKFCPCNSDFPGFYNCILTKKRFLLKPSKGAVVSIPYFKIDRVIHAFPLDPDLWDKMLNR